MSDSSQGRRLTPRDLFPPLELFLNHQTYIAQEPLGRVGRADARAGPPQDRASPRGNGRSRIDVAMTRLGACDAGSSPRLSPDRAAGQGRVPCALDEGAAPAAQDWGV